MGKCDLVMVGAEAVAWSGGCVNSIGTFAIALAAKHFNKPVYGLFLLLTNKLVSNYTTALAESFKFLRLYPLSQQDLPTSSPLLQFDDPDPDADFPAILGRKAPSRVLRKSAAPETIRNDSGAN